MTISKFLFGVSNVINVSLLDNERQEITPSADSPTIYVFDSLPSRTAAAAGTGAIQTISSWTGSGSKRAVTIAAISDPDPASSARYKEYYLGINFTLVASGQVQTTIERFEVERVLSQVDNLTITAQDAKDIYPTISAYLSDALIAKYITGAIDDVKAELSGKGIDWAAIKNPKDYKRAIVFKAIADASLSQIQEPEDKFEKRYNIYTARADKLLSCTTAVIDTDKDGTPDKVTPSKPNYYIMMR